MSRLTDVLLDQRGYGKGALQPMNDLKYGGMFGYTPDLTQWVSNQAYVRRNLVAILLEAPRFFQLMPDPQKWVEALRALVELHPRTIEGLNEGLTVEFDEHPVGGAGEQQQEYVDVKRERSEPVFGYVDKYGRPIQTFIQNWIQYGMMDPDTKYALVATLSGERPDDLLADWYTMTVLFFEPDPMHRKVNKAFLTTNMMPKETGAIEGKKDKTSPNELSTLSIGFTGITQVGIGVRTFAQQILDSTNLVNANPYARPSIVQNISSDVDSASDGYVAGINTLAGSAVTSAGSS